MDELKPDTELCVQEFLDARYELPEAGQWAELEAGRFFCFQPPDVDHGTVVLNLSKAVARWANGSSSGYACFDLGLILNREPDTVRFPAVSFFVEGERFSENDQDATETVPVVVVELASTADRRRAMGPRVADYVEFGVKLVLVIDPSLEQVTIWVPGLPKVELSKGDELAHLQPLPGFEIRVEDLFAVPEWWQARRR